MILKLILKTTFLVAVLLLLVIMGMNNRDPVQLKMPPFLSKPQEHPAALMYFAFFGIGLVTGSVLTAGTKRSKPKSE